MNVPESKPSLIASLTGKKCPNCRKGYVFKSKSIFPLGKMLAIHEHCPECGQKLVSEKNNGQGINYALTIIMFILNFSWYYPIYDYMSRDSKLHWYEDNSVEWYLFWSTIVVVLLQPWLMRLSRMVYLYLYIGFGSNDS
jgi:endogenous inhibitor of DNA gyrase (YacG/DUF329 family)